MRLATALLSLGPLLVTGACADDASPAQDDDEGSGGADSDSSSESGSDDSTTSVDTSSGDAVDTSESSSDGDSSSSGGASSAIAVDDLFRVPMERTLVVAAQDGLLANDMGESDLAVDVLQSDLVSAKGGDLAIEVDGTFEYTPPDATWGPDSFVYAVVDASGGQATATATINVIPVEIPSAELAEDNGGFEITAVTTNEFSFALSSAGDVNGDGIDDMILGRPWHENRGSASVVFGGPGLAGVDFDTLAEDDGGFLVYTDAFPNYFLGTFVAGLGDVNGDGLADVALADPDYYMQSVENLSYVHVVFGKMESDPVDVADIAGGDGGFTISARTQLTGSTAMIHVDGAGDVNGDGLGDVLVAVPRAEGTDERLAWVVFGKNDGDLVDLDEVSAGEGGFLIGGSGIVSSPVLAFRWARGAGDVNGDGLADVVIGNDGDSRASVVFGKTDADPIDLSDLGDAGLTIEGAVASERIGTVVAGAGDVDGDGLDDVLIGAPWSFEEDSRAFLVYGVSEPATISIDDIWDGIGGFGIEHEPIPGFHLGMSVAGGGDVDGDGLDDIVIGGPNWTTLADSRAYVVYGSAGTVSPLQLGVWPDGDVGYVIDSFPGFVGSSFPDQAAIVGDLDDDGLDDIFLSHLMVSPRAHFMSGVSRAPY